MATKIKASDLCLWVLFSVLFLACIHECGRAVDRTPVRTAAPETDRTVFVVDPRP